MKSNDKQTQALLVRRATQAGRFYESNPKVLSHQVDSLLDRHANDSNYTNVAALIVPHAGHYFSGNVAAAAYMAISPEKHYKRIFMIGPSHYEWLDGASVNSEADGYATPLGTVSVDRETALQLIGADTVFTYHEKAHDREHCLEVQLPFLQRRMKNVPPIVPIIISTNDYQKLKKMAEVLKPYFNDENLFVISSDFSHYPAYEDACKVDAKTKEAIMSGDVQRFIAAIEDNALSGTPRLETTACGEFPIITLMLMLNDNYEMKHLLYQNSGDIDNHDRRRVVGYHAFAVLRNANSGKQQAGIGFVLTDEEKQLLKQIARKSIATAFDKQTFDPATLCQHHPTLKQKCGAFVTLNQHGQLRGCIGLLSGSLPLYETIYEMARAAAFEDPRFNQLRREEMDVTDIEISVITPMRRINSIEEFQLHRHGIYIKKGRRSGTFLPQVADEVDWSKEEFLGHCSRDKAGLGWDGWRDAELYVYEAIVF
ncbi:MAG: AmmeMemoRadiSam system protein B [Prevotella sp.]|nr:AmmeMemoRadiSam system protein B [Prevotella sp.]